jgi:hypothetical protein
MGSTMRSHRQPIIPTFHYSITPIPSRWCGIFSNRWKKQYLALARSALKQQFIIDSEKQSIPCWAERQMNYTGRNPLLCPFCNQELTFIGTVFGNWNELQFIFEQYGKDPSIHSYLLKPG